MSRNRTAEEVKQHHIEVMGEDLGTLFHALWNELAWLYFEWSEYVELFGTKPSRIDLLNQAAGRFFRMVQDSFWEDALLHISRLTDRPKIAGKENLTIRKLPDLITDKELKNHVSKLIDTAIDKADFCRDWRNRHIAHKDLQLALRTGAKPLKPPSRAKIKEVLVSISEVLNALSVHYMDSTIMFEGIGHSSALSLLYVLDDGLKSQKERQERRKAGEYRAEDYKPRDL